MSDYKINEAFNPNKVFMISSKELNKRLDPFFYIPSLVELENKVKEKNPKPLRDYVLSVSSGATPKTTEAEKYYSDKENGIPFLRVQNLSQYGFLQLDDCKYINKETHENYLKRSQVAEGDLLIKITGVGRMAVASVAPDGFVGNCNQHLVVIRTGSKEISTIIAAYLNTDIGEKLASKRAAGGTRPAIDYTALLSIPIIFNEQILEITKKAVDTKTEKELQAQKLLDSIDDYLLAELGIVLPPKNNSLENRIFTTSINEISGSRFDSSFYSPYNKAVIHSIKNSKYNIEPIKANAKFLAGYAFSSNDYLENSDCLLLTIKNISKNRINLNNVTYLPSSFFELHKDFQVIKSDLLIAMTGATIGKVGIYESESKSLLNQRNGIIRATNFNTYYLMNLLNTEVYQGIILKNSVGGAQPNISETDIMKLGIPVPPISKQNELADKIKLIRDEANLLQQEAIQAFEIAKKQVEQLLLGN